VAKMTKHQWTADEPPHHINRRANDANNTAAIFAEVLVTHKNVPPHDAIKIAWQMALDLDALRCQFTAELVRKFNSGSPDSPASLFQTDDEEEGDDQ
jgi:hypothetical protein